MLANYVVLLALCLGQSEVTTSLRSGFASSDNFVVYAPDQELADEVLKKAELLRTELSRAWLGKEFAPGNGPCRIYVKLSQIEHKALTWPKDHPAKHYHSMTLKSTRENILGHTLAHEITHVVMATEFSGKLPRWTDEGIAMFQDDSERKTGRREWLNSFVQSGNWPNLAMILQQKGAASDEYVFFTVAESVTEFLLEQDGTDVFFRFAVDGEENGWESATKRHYEFRSLRDLESRWQGWVANRLRRRVITANSIERSNQPKSVRGISRTAIEPVAK